MKGNLRLWSIYVFMSPHCLMASPSPATCCWLIFLGAATHPWSHPQLRSGCDPQCAAILEPLDPAGTTPLPTTFWGLARGNLHCLIWWWSWQTTCSLWLWKFKRALRDFDQRSSTALFALETTHTSFETLRATARLGLSTPALPCNPNLPADNEMLRCCSTRT